MLYYHAHIYTVYLERRLKVNSHKPDVAASISIYVRQIQREGKLYLNIMFYINS